MLPWIMRGVALLGVIVLAYAVDDSPWLFVLAPLWGVIVGLVWRTLDPL